VWEILFFQVKIIGLRYTSPKNQDLKEYFGDAL